MDFVLDGGAIAAEVKISDNPRPGDYNGLLAFCNDHKPKHAIIVCLAAKKRLTDNNVWRIQVFIYPVEDFLKDLWDGKLLQ